jgi:hypothetical protein
MSEIAKPKSCDPSSLDPMTEPWWTLPMAISWIIWRTPDEVRTEWRKYDEEFRDLNRLPDGTRPGSGLRSLYDILNSTYDDALPRTFIVEGRPACDDLWRRLKDGELVANGIPVGSEGRRIITSMEWLDLDSFDPDWPVDAIGRGYKHILRFNSVVVQSKDVVRIWSNLDNVPMITAAHQDNANGVSATPIEDRAQGKKPRIKVYLREHFASGVPAPAFENRQQLATKLLKWDASLHPLDQTTLRKAIGEYNASLR